MCPSKCLPRKVFRTVQRNWWNMAPFVTIKSGTTYIYICSNFFSEKKTPPVVDLVDVYIYIFINNVSHWCFILPVAFL